ncbi:hypothetical protein D0Z07_4701 [Hyphodiscus hymeniophilus]|uniref:Pathway-specific nitrogen regulator n=1 Tax=Hyphodiscus hymeniophilus TaxID=353542 RepID=A0A9P7AWN0_9HELO|nr:hypothetical protein D0Z07_4701 [Hyphodiscus hymeniophilus]
MPKTPPPPAFQIHVDPSCLTDTTKSEMAPAERVVSDQTVVHHDSWSEEDAPVIEEKPADGAAVEDVENPEQQHPEEDLSDEESSHNARERQIDRIEAQIQAAARAVVASIEKDHYDGHKDSILDMQTDKSYEQEGSQMTYDEGTELTYGDGTELTYDGTETSYEPHSEHEEEEAAGDSSSHHDGDIDDDDVFSRDSGHSARSSLNSIHDLSSADEVQSKELTSPKVGEEAIHSSPAAEDDDTISRIPSSSSYVPRDATPATPSKVLSRPPFRTPSSVRALQMSSPTPSIFSSPRSSKRHLPTVSRIGTPTSFSHSPSKNRTPTRFKVKKEYPLVLLHVTVLPLTWNYSHVISSSELPDSLQRVKENWRLLQKKLGDTVLERGILLPHPQESYEILEERLLEALELPVRPRARILKCGHYMGPETPSSDEEGVAYFEGGEKLEGERKWCDICGRDVRFEGVDMAGREGEQKFRIKIYASNGLMRAGAWAACWREMERVDVEIEPFIESTLVSELEDFAAVAVVPDIREEEVDEFVDEDTGPGSEHNQHIEEHADDEVRAQQEEEMARALMEEEELRIRAQEEEDVRRKLQDDERMREVYGHEATVREQSRHRPLRSPSSSLLDDDSLPDLLLKAFKVAMRDKKNIAICVLSIIVLLLALRPGNTTLKHPQVIMTDSAPVRDIEIKTEAMPTQASLNKATAESAKVAEVLEKKRPAIRNSLTDEQPVMEVVEETWKTKPVAQKVEEHAPILDNSFADAAATYTEPLRETPSKELPLEAAIMGLLHDGARLE